MKIRLSVLSVLLALVIGGGAAAAQGTPTTFSIIISSPSSTAVTCTPVSPWTLSGSTLSYPKTSPLPVPANSAICALSISPAGWSGTLALSGTNAASFALNGTAFNIGAAALGVGTYSVTITATP